MMDAPDSPPTETQDSSAPQSSVSKLFSAANPTSNGNAKGARPTEKETKPSFGAPGTFLVESKTSYLGHLKSSLPSIHCLTRRETMGTFKVTS